MQSGSNKLRVGVFGGMIVIFANLMLVCAVVLGEVKVSSKAPMLERSVCVGLQVWISVALFR